MEKSLEVATGQSQVVLHLTFLGIWAHIAITLSACESVAGAKLNHNKLAKLFLSSIPRPVLSNPGTTQSQ